MKKNPAPKKKMEVKSLRNKIEPYSVIKIKEKSPPPYSVLNPETSSDSPSEKSNGDRFDSAKQISNQTIINGKDKKENQT